MANARDEMAKGEGLGIFLVKLPIYKTKFKLLKTQIIAVCVVGVIFVGLTIVIYLQPESVSFVAFKVISVTLKLAGFNKTPLHCQVPGVPFVPILSILLNVYLMASLDAETWAKFLAWMVIGDLFIVTNIPKSHLIKFPLNKNPSLPFTSFISSLNFQSSRKDLKQF